MSHSWGSLQPEFVTQAISRKSAALVTVTFTELKSGKIADKMICTPEHPIFVQNKGWVPAGMLNSGDFVITGNGGTLAVDSISWQRDEKHGFTVYNLTVEDDHTYFVGTVDGGVWVHNVPCTALVEFQIDDYGRFNYKERSGDGFDGHEIVQNAWLEEHGLLTLKSQNPALALNESNHNYVTTAQRRMGLFNRATLRELTARQIIDRNIIALKIANTSGASIPESAIDAAEAAANTFIITHGL